MPIMTAEEINVLFGRVVSGEIVYDEEIEDALDDLRTVEYEGIDVQEIIEVFTEIQKERAADEEGEDPKKKFDLISEPNEHLTPQVASGFEWRIMESIGVLFIAPIAAIIGIWVAFFFLIVVFWPSAVVFVVAIVLFPWAQAQGQTVATIFLVIAFVVFWIPLGIRAKSMYDKMMMTDRSGEARKEPKQKI